MSQSLNYRRTLATLPLLAALAVPTVGLTQNQSAEWGSITPSHVYQVTEQIIEEVDILRDAIGVMDIPVYPEPQNSRTPVHSYAKALEVMEKISRAERKLGMAPVEVEQLPIKVIIPEDVLNFTKSILVEIQKIKDQLAIEDVADEPRFVGGKTSNDVYESLWVASYLLDGIVGSPLTPNDVYRTLDYVIEDLNLISTKMKLPLELNLPEIDGRKRPKEVTQQGLLNLYKVINLQTRLGMDPSNVPNVLLIRVTPSDTYDIANTILAELNRIKVELEINLPHESRRLPTGKRANDTFAQMRLIGNNLDVLLKST